MSKFTKLLGAAAILAGGGLATGVYADASAVTCGQFAAMDDVGRLTYAHDLLLWIEDTANNEAAGAELVGRYAPWAAQRVDRRGRRVDGRSSGSVDP